MHFPNDSKNNHRQRDKHINRLKREHISLRTKLVISFDRGKIKKSKNLVKPWA